MGGAPPADSSAERVVAVAVAAVAETSDAVAEMAAVVVVVAAVARIPAAAGGTALIVPLRRLDLDVEIAASAEDRDATVVSEIAVFAADA